MKIAYIYPALNTVGGADRVITEKANYLADICEYEIYIITAHQNNAPIYFPLSKKIKHIDLSVNFDEQYKHSFIIRAFIYLKLLRQYKKLLSQKLNELKVDFTITTISRDIDFLHKLKDGSLKIAEAHIAKPFVRNLHLLKTRGLPYRIVAKIWTRKLENSIAHFDALVVLTSHDAEQWKHVKKATIIPNSLPFYPEEGSDCKEKKIISVGRLDEQKGYDLLIDSWSIVNKRHPDWSIDIYGNGILKTALVYKIRERKFEETFRLNEPVINIMNKYLASSIYVMSSRFEGFGMVLAEAMACGVPCVSFNCPYGPADIISDGNDGLLVENSNTTEMAEKICYLIENEDVRREMGNRAKSNISRYKPDIVMKHWTDLFSELKKTVE
nr:glycosyltransferase family 4 protein [uncultured Bacteroides sp.]